jgi:hypothetical protein
LTEPSEAVPDPPAEQGSSSNGRRAFGRWPFGIIAVAVLRLVDASALIVLGIEQRGLDVTGLPILGDSAVMTRALDLTLAVLTIGGVLGLLAFKRWGWVLTMVLVGVSLLGDLIRVAIGQPGYLGLALHVLTAFYLNGSAVRALADRHLDDDVRARP